MTGRVTRRHLLRGTAAATGVALCASIGALAQGQSDDHAFVPDRNGFGFRNWSPRTQYFDPPPDPPRAAIRERVRRGWRDQARPLLGLDTGRLPDRLVDAMATQLRSAVVQRAGTNGHCYGMVLAAQQYFERPETIPVDRRTASEIENPIVPIEEPAAPVYEDIVQLQAAQFLRFRSWLGRRALLHPEWIDTRAVLSDVRSVVERFGTAALILFDESLFSHQVLAYGVEDRGDSVVIPIYDPNRPAATYRAAAPELRFDRDGETVSMATYGRYTGVLFNRYDRIERATDRDSSSPGDHLRVDASTMLASLFPLVLVLVDADDVELAVDAPDGEELDRVRGSHMDGTRGDYARVRTLYGAAPGSYRIRVFGGDETDYELTVVAAAPDGVLVDTTRSAAIGSGGLHEYDLEIPEDGRGSMDRVGSGVGRRALVGGAGVAGGVALGALGHRALQRRWNRE